MKKLIPISLTSLTVLAIVTLIGCATFNEFKVAGGAWHLYKKNCSGCHGLDGQGIPPAGPVLKGSKFVNDSSVEDIKEVIRKGRKGESKEYPQYLFEDGGYMNMPPFAERTIPDDQLDILAKWVKNGMPQR
jgi:mono/diheme cytochrome c family protein